MQNRHPFYWIMMMSLIGVIACTHTAGPLNLATDVGRETIADSDVEEVYLKYDHRDGRYFAVIALNKMGSDRVGRLIEGKAGDRRLEISLGERRLTSVPVMTDRIDKLLIKFDDRRSAVDLLKNLSR